jgi:hypothetical protein
MPICSLFPFIYSVLPNVQWLCRFQACAHNILIQDSISIIIMVDLKSIIDAQWGRISKRDSLSEYSGYVSSCFDELGSYSCSLKLFNNLAEKEARTSEHSVRVLMYSLCLAKKAGIPWDSEDSIGALLHDLGKYDNEVSEVISTQKKRLTLHQEQVIRKHPILGQEFCSLSSNGELSERSYDKIRHHHERMNGTGYPDHLKGEEISKQLRIVSIADFYDVLANRLGWGKILTDVMFKRKQARIMKAMKIASSAEGSPYGHIDSEYSLRGKKVVPGHLDPYLTDVFMSMVRPLTFVVKKSIS